MKKVNKLYLKLNEENVIIGYFKMFKLSPYNAVGCNFDEAVDFKKAVICDLNEAEIEVGVDKFENGKLVKVGE